MLIDDLLKVVSNYTNGKNIAEIESAYYFARDSHEGQYRVSGEPFIEHPLGVAYILAELKLDVVSITAALMHDVVEDTSITSDDIKSKFGEEIALLVDGVTKLTRINFQSKEEHQAESLRKMFLAMAEDIRVILIKLADRLHNMRTLHYLSKKKQYEKSRETLDIYAPLAHRLGMSRIKWELEDLSFRYLMSEKYFEISKKVTSNRKQREKEIKEAIDLIGTKIKERGIKAEIFGRPKHLYSIYQKMKKKEIDFNEIYDLTAIRVIVESVRECYEILGLVHEISKPIPGRFKDYIAMPKSNMYQSLHTTVIGPSGEPLEIQIRTFDMHKTAEFGIAAHWKYKEGVSDDKFENKLSWLRQLLEWQKDMKEPHEFMEALKIDLFEDEVFVFTPQGDVISLPREGTPVDFAYNIHTEVGHNCVGAKVNGKIVPLEYKLRNGDIVEILTSNNSGPTRDWLKFVKTSKARSKIKHWFKKQQKEEIIQRGKNLLLRCLRRNNIKINETDKELNSIASKMNKDSISELYEAVGYSQIKAKQIIDKLSPEKEQKNIFKDKLTLSRAKKSVDKGIKVKGMDDLLVRTAKCCNPVPGDNIIGYITRGRGVSVHRTDCPNLKSLKEDENRIIDVSWDDERTESYEVNMTIDAFDRKNLLNDITQLIKDEDINLISLAARTKDNQATIDIALELSSREHMRDIMDKMEEISGILAVRRSRPT